MAIGQLDIHMPKNMALDTDLTLITKINSGWIIDSFILFKKKKKEWIIDPNGKHRIVQFLEHNIGESPDDAGYGDDFLDTTPKTQSMK